MRDQRKKKQNHKNLSSNGLEIKSKVSSERDNNFIIFRMKRSKTNIKEKHENNNAVIYELIG
jgi:hypothetical protein